MLKSNRKNRRYSSGINSLSSALDVFIDLQDVLLRTNISKRTLQRWRSNGILPYYKIGGKIFYNENEVKEVMEKHKRTYNKQNG